MKADGVDRPVLQQSMNADWQSFVIRQSPLPPKQASPVSPQSPKETRKTPTSRLNAFGGRTSGPLSVEKGRIAPALGPSARKIHPNSLSRHRYPWPCQGWTEIAPERDRTAPVFRHDNFPLRRCAFVIAAGIHVMSAVAKRYPSCRWKTLPSHGWALRTHADSLRGRRDWEMAGPVRDGPAILEHHLGAPSWLSPFRAGCVEMERWRVRTGGRSCYFLWGKN